jgi:hypothetical protein
MWSLRTSQCTAAPHLARITQPALVIHATADTGVYSSDARALYDALADAFVPGVPGVSRQACGGRGRVGVVCPYPCLGRVLF